MEFKALKTTKEITSKVNTGVPKKSSTLTFVHSRQSSTLSRTSSRQSHLNLADRKSSNTNLAGKARPTTSFISTRVTHPSSSSCITVDDKLPLGVHRLGTLPAYLRNKRPATATAKLESGQSPMIHRKTDSPKEEPFKFDAVTPSKAATQQGDAKEETKNDDSGIQVSSPPCEGQTPDGSEALQEMVQEMGLKEILSKMRHLGDSCDGKQKRIEQLESEIVRLRRSIEDRDDDIQKMKFNMNKVRSLANNRDTIARDGLQELEKKLDSLQKELTQKCNDLFKSKDKISRLKQKLAESTATVEERDRTIFDLLEKDAVRAAEFKATQQSSDELKQQLTALRKELTAKDTQIIEMQTNDPMKLVQSEVDAYHSVVATLRKEVEQLRFENQMLASLKKQDDVMLQIRTKLFENVERNKESYKAQLKQLCRSGSVEEIDEEINQIEEVSSRQRRSVFEELDDKQCAAEDQTDEQWKEVGSQILSMAKLLIKENKGLLDIVSHCDADTQDGEHMRSVENDEQNQLVEDSLLSEESTILVRESDERCDVEEEITSRIVYDEQILSI
ncbi:uncharacterized protein LOC134214749 isoform X2 [Armigeres subalbatus]|uniref:uncharacterized protein LOC134214749 isoform X2 n=1 Tax=Armigeres subalbatus TaxID=124917 RepID=UPI002ED512D5